MKILIVGQGISALTCAKLLLLNGWQVQIMSTSSYSKPTLVLNPMTYNLLQNIWSIDLTAISYQFSRRKVLWAEDLITHDNGGYTIEGDTLQKYLMQNLHSFHHKDISTQKHQGKLDFNHLLKTRANKNFWFINASGREKKTSNNTHTTNSYGNRLIVSFNVKLRKESETCWTETTKNAWFFLAPSTKKTGVLQIMLPKPNSNFKELIEETIFIKDQIESYYITAKFKAFPQISFPLYGKNWSSLGEAAMCFDPLCGDGTGYAIKEALLTTAIISSIAKGIPFEDCLNHYKYRLCKTFIVHIQNSLEYYMKAFTSSIWQLEIQSMKKIIHHPEYHKAINYNFNYTLVGNQDLKQIEISKNTPLTKKKNDKL